MNKIFILALLFFGAYACDPADPVPNFMDFNDKDSDGALSLREWAASEVPHRLRVELNLRSGSEFKRLDANRDDKISLDELGTKPSAKIYWSEDPCAFWPWKDQGGDENQSAVKQVRKTAMMRPFAQGLVCATRINFTSYRRVRASFAPRFA